MHHPHSAPDGHEAVRTPAAAAAAAAAGSNVGQLLAELSTAAQAVAFLQDGASCRLLAGSDEAPYAWLTDEAPRSIPVNAMDPGSASQPATPTVAGASAAAAAPAAGAIVRPVPSMALLPSLVDLSAEHWSLNQAYYHMPILRCDAFPAAFPLLCYAQLPPSLMAPVQEMFAPLETMTACGTYYVCCRDAVPKRGQNTAALTFRWHRQSNVAMSDDEPSAASANSTMDPDDALVQLTIKLYSHKGLLNRNAHYRRGRVACVVYSPRCAVTVVAYRTSAHSDMVMLREEPNRHEPLFALALDTCYQVNFFSANDTVAIQHVDTQIRPDLEVIVSSAPTLPWPSYSNSPASATLLLLHQSPSSFSSQQPATSSPSGSAGLHPPSLTSSPALTLQMQSQMAVVPTRARISCASCRKAKAKCDEQRSARMDLHAALLLRMLKQ